MKALQFGCIVVAMTIVGINPTIEETLQKTLSVAPAHAANPSGTFHHRAAERSVVRCAAYDALSDIRFS